MALSIILVLEIAAAITAFVLRSQVNRHHSQETPQCVINNTNSNNNNYYLFQPVALETLGPINDSAVDFLSELGGGRIGTASGEIRERQFLFQRLSVTIQRFNAILLHNSFVDRDDQDL